MVRAAADGLTAAEVAEHTGQHLSTTRVHLERLASAGLLRKTRTSDGRPGRPAWRYRPAGDNPAPAPAPYRALAAALLDHLVSERGQARPAVDAGEAWGRTLAAATPTPRPVDAVHSVLQALDFDPVVVDGQPTDRLELHLRRCPFLELASRNPDAMCGLHLGVIRGVLDHHGVAPTSVTLEPFGAPTACVAQLPPAAGKASTKDRL